MVIINYGKSFFLLSNIISHIFNNISHKIVIINYGKSFLLSNIISHIFNNISHKMVIINYGKSFYTQ